MTTADRINQLLTVLDCNYEVEAHELARECSLDPETPFAAATAENAVRAARIKHGLVIIRGIAANDLGLESCRECETWVESGELTAHESLCGHCKEEINRTLDEQEHATQNAVDGKE